MKSKSKKQFPTWSPNWLPPWSTSRWEKLTMVCCPQACRPQTSWNLKVDDAGSYLHHHQPIRMSTSWFCPLWFITIKLLTILSKWGHIVFRGRSLLCFPFAWQRINLLFDFLQTLSPYFYLASVGQGVKILAITWRFFFSEGHELNWTELNWRTWKKTIKRKMPHPWMKR